MKRARPRQGWCGTLARRDQDAVRCDTGRAQCWRDTAPARVPALVGAATRQRRRPYSPELNPAENIWQFLRQNHLSNRVFESYTNIVDACCAAWNALIEEPKRITSIATRDWASVSPSCCCYNIINEFTHECLAILIDRKLKSIDVIDVLSDLFVLPEHFRQWLEIRK